MTGSVSPAGPSKTKPGFVPGFCVPAKRRFVLVAAILASALGFIDGTMVALALPAMRESLQAGLVEALWINTGYLLPLSALILLGGALGDRFGTARIFAIGIGGFVLASLACAVAPSAETLIVARIAQGGFAALMIPGSLSLIARAYPREERGRAIGQWAAASSLTTALGPILAGLALSYGGPEIWRWLFAINLPLGGFALWLVITQVDHDPARPDHPLDLPGGVLITAGLAAVTFALIGGGEEGHLAYPWLAAMGVGLTVVFVLWQMRAPHPMVPLWLFSDRGFAGANGATALIYFALSAVMFFLPMTLIAGRGWEPMWVSVSFAPLSLLIPLLSGRAGTLADRHGPGRLIGAGGALTAMSYLWLSEVVPNGDLVSGVLPATALMGVGMGLLIAPLSTAVLAAVPEEMSGLASGINNAVTRVAGLVAIAALGLVAAIVYTQAGGTESFGEVAEVAGHTDATIAAFQSVARVSGLICAVGAAIAWAVIPRPPA